MLTTGHILTVSDRAYRVNKTAGLREARIRTLSGGEDREVVPERKTNILDSSKMLRN